MGERQCFYLSRITFHWIIKTSVWSADIHVDWEENTRLITSAALTCCWHSPVCGACGRRRVWGCVFIWFKVIRLKWHLFVISCIGVGPGHVSPLSWHKRLVIPRKRKALILSPRRSHTDCISSLNDSVNVPHQRMIHSTTLLLWWFFPSVYYIMQQRVLLSYMRHNKRPHLRRAGAYSPAFFGRSSKKLLI